MEIYQFNHVYGLVPYGNGANHFELTTFPVPLYKDNIKNKWKLFNYFLFISFGIHVKMSRLFHFFITFQYIKCIFEFEIQVIFHILNYENKEIG